RNRGNDGRGGDSPVSVSVAHMTSPMPGQRANGDAVFVRREGDDCVLLAVIDGLGHGPVAEEASKAATARLEGTSLDLSLLETMQMLHESIHHTRGAAATLCILRGRRIEACAVGN